MREVLAGGGAGFVDGTESTIEENAAALGGSFEDESFVCGFLAIVCEKAGDGDAEKPSQTGYVAFEQPRGGNLAAVGTDSAINGILDGFGGAAEANLDVAMPLQVLAESLVFSAFLLAEPANLHQVGDHSL